MGFLEKFKEQEEERIRTNLQMKEKRLKEIELRSLEAFELFDRVGVLQMLNEVNIEFWNGMGKIIDSKDRETKRNKISLEFQYDTAMPKYKTEKVKVVVERDTYSSGQNPGIIGSYKSTEYQDQKILSGANRYRATSALTIDSYVILPKGFHNGNLVLGVNDTNVGLVDEKIFGDSRNPSDGIYSINGRRVFDSLGAIKFYIDFLNGKESTDNTVREFLEVLIWRSCTERKRLGRLPQSLMEHGQKEIEKYRDYL